MPFAPVVRQIALAAVLGTALAAAPLASAQVPLGGLVNGGCETPIDPTDRTPVGWTSTPTGAWECRNGDAFGGPAAREGARAFLNGGGQPGESVTLTQRIQANSALAGRTVTFTAYGARPVGNGDRIALTLAFFNPSDVQVGATTTNTFTPVSGVWTKYTVTALAPAGSSRLQVGMRCVADAVDFCDAIFDDTSLATDQALPVELVAFTAAASGTGARLAWTTASETNNSGFVVEQQRGGDWADASTFIAGRGTTSERTDYTTDVTGLTAGRHSFRLRQTDVDGTTTRSAPVTVEIAAPGGHRVTLLGRRAVRIEAAEQAVRVAVYDVLGREVWTDEASVSGTADVALPSLARGAYVVRVTGERFETSRTLVVR